MQEDMQDGRVEDGEIDECAVCDTTMHLYEEDNHICPGCAHGGWEWTKAMYVRRGDIVRLSGKQVEVDGEEDFNLRKAIYDAEGNGWIRRQTTPVLIRR